MLPILRHRLTRRVLGTLLFELVALNVVIVALLFSRSSHWEVPELTLKMIVFALSCTAIIQFGFWSFGLYSRQVVYSGRKVARRLFEASIVLSVVLFCFCYFFSLGWGDPLFHPTTRFFPVFLIVVFPIVVFAERYLVLRLFNEASHFGRVFVVGSGVSCLRVVREARAHHGDTLQFVGILGNSGEEIGQSIEGVPVIGTISQLAEMVDERGARTIILALPYDHPELPLDYLLECKIEGRNVVDAGAFYESVAQKILLERLEPYSVLFPEGYTMTRVRWVLKSAFERVLACVLLAVLGVPLLIVALLVKLTSPGGAIYRQERVGKSGKTFLVLKFRTMVQDAEAGGVQWAQKNDARVTRLGRFLRRTRIDELPQLINVLRGEMAFIGPRPERPKFVDQFKHDIPFYHFRHFVKPGITGWAQVQFAYARSLDDTREKLRFDLYYIKHVSLFFDAMILLATLRAVVRGGGVN